MEIHKPRTISRQLIATLANQLTSMASPLTRTLPLDGVERGLLCQVEEDDGD
jgi:hypothetical protein